MNYYYHGAHTHTQCIRDILSVQVLYSAIHSFWPVEELEELTDGPTGCGEVARGGCLFAWNFSVTISRSRGLGQTRGCRYISDSFLAYWLKIPPAKNNSLHYKAAYAETWQLSHLWGRKTDRHQV
jgi:hypothetical protein